VETASSTRKARNVEARPRASLMVDDRRPGATRWVLATGRAELIRGDRSRELNQRLLRRYLTEAGMETMGRFWTSVDDVTIALTPESWKSWDARALVASLREQGSAPKTGEQWFLPPA